MRGKRVLSDIPMTVKTVNALLQLVQCTESFYALTALTMMGMSLSTLLPRITNLYPVPRVAVRSRFIWFTRN